MRAPAVGVAAAFASGITLGLHPLAASHASSLRFIAGYAILAVVFFLTGMFFLKVEKLFPAATAAVVCWVTLGLLAASLAEQPRRADHALALIEAGKIDLRSPLRWHGRLRDEPTKLPWGYGYELELSAVESEDTLLPTTGGLRLSYTVRPEQTLPTEVHAGDTVTVVAQAKLPQLFKDEGAFDRRAYLAQQNVHLVGTLRAPELLVRESVAQPTMRTQLARVRHRLREEIDELFAAKPEISGVLRAMLLGDRTFVDRAEAVDFQKTGVFHVLVVAGLHVGAIAWVLFWVGRKLKVSVVWTILFTLTLLLAYVAVVEQRPPVLRAALMAAIVALGTFFFRRLDLLNSAAVAALILLVSSPLSLRDSSFQLTFVAIGCIAGLALPWLDATVLPYARALRGWRDVTRDAAHVPLVAQFRIDVRSLLGWMFSRLPQRSSRTLQNGVVAGVALAFRVWELFVLTIVLQIGMLPLMARDFHRITLSAPLVNLAAVPLTGVIVPLGFVTLASGLVMPAAGRFLAAALAQIILLLLHVVQWFAHLPRWNYRIPGPPMWLIILFFVLLALLAASWRWGWLGRRWFKRFVLVAIASAALLVAIYPFAPRWVQGSLEATVLDVGQGDSIFVISPAGKTLLIDGGGAFGGFPGREEHNDIDPGEEAVSPYLWSRGFQRIDVVALTHAHQDHLGGLAAVLQNFRVGRLWIGREVSSPALARLETIARERHISLEHEMSGKTFSWDGVQGEFLWPDATPEDMAASAKNNDSLVLHLKYGERTILLPGDAEKQAEARILGSNDPEKLRADVLKIGHHGSKNSTTEVFLATVNPSVAIVSAGADNPYGHPSPELLERLEGAKVRLLRTDRDGAIRVLTNGSELGVTCFVPCIWPGPTPSK